MANTKSAKKRVLQSEKHRRHNVSRRSMIRTYIKRVQAAIDSDDKNTAMQAFTTVQSVLDKQARKGLIHKNKAARNKANLAMRISNMAA